MRPTTSRAFLTPRWRARRIRWEMCPPRARRRLASELPARASPSSIPWQV
jgi:hypothetical protein